MEADIIKSLRGCQLTEEEEVVIAVEEVDLAAEIHELRSRPADQNELPKLELLRLGHHRAVLAISHRHKVALVGVG
ncbi:hypothetical protein LIER_22211 [Lithospermum erythrorhizon]|uniref:Uncharacterized protein n=1 Tax=Lithospermum erythrorhizon TaxID=34254 RepID=A0AAV3QT80_LITER